MLRPQAWFFSKVSDNNREFKKKKKDPFVTSRCVTICQLLQELWYLKIILIIIIDI